MRASILRVCLAVAVVLAMMLGLRPASELGCGPRAATMACCAAARPVGLPRQTPARPMPCCRFDRAPDSAAPVVDTVRVEPAGASVVPWHAPAVLSLLSAPMPIRAVSATLRGPAPPAPLPLRL